MLVALMVYPLSVVCRVLNVTQMGFHAWRIREPSTRERDLLRADIRKVFDVHRGRYGAPRLYRVLRARHGYTGMESFWHSLKVEETHGQDFATHAESIRTQMQRQRGRRRQRRLIHRFKQRQTIRSAE